MKNLLYLLPLLALSAFAAAPPPANDDFANRTALVSSGSISISDRNASATTQALEPTIAGDVVSRSVWYSWTAPFSGPVIISTAGSSFDTLLGVFTGTGLGALTSIAENDDAGTGAFTSRVNFNAVIGIPYVICVGGYNGAGGKINLSISVGAGPCTYSVNPTSKSFSDAAGSGTVTVTTQTGCSWSAASNDSFIAITSGSTGTGSGTVAYTVTASTALTARVGTMTIAGATVTISQAAAPACTYSLFPTSTNAPSDSVTNTVAMTTGTGCTWNATPNGSWITIASGASGTGNGTITYVLAANTNSNHRVGTITAAGQTFTITQAGTVICTYSISPSSGFFTSTGGSSNIVISTITSCAWTASSPATWVTFSTTNGSGSGTVTYTVAANTNTVSRSTTLTVAGQSYSVQQTGAACTYSISPSSKTVLATNGTSSVTVTAGQGCGWTAVANVSWITVTAGTSGTGSGSVVFTYAANLNTVSRSGTITIAGLTFTLFQQAAACIYSITPTAVHYLAAGGPGTIAVTAGTGCAWTAVSNDAWATVDSGTPGSGNGTVGYTVTANATAVSRTGTFTVAGQTFTITQDGTVPCTYSIAPASASFTSLGGTNSVAVTANTGCTWSVSSAATWLTFSPANGSGNGTVSYTVASNPSSLTRTGTITIAGQTFTVTQTGVVCTYTLSPTSATYGSVGGTGTATVTATQGCNWTSSSDSPWLVVTSGSAGVGNGSVGYSVAAATNSVTRTGRLTIATKLLIVTQTGIACTYSIAPQSATFSNAGGGGTISINASDVVCAWTATSGATWITVSPANGSGSGSVDYTVASTSLSTSRTGTLTVAGQTFTVTQTGDTTPPVVALTVPANGSTISNIVSLTATATDNGSVSRVEFYRDAAVLIGTDLTSPYTLPFQTTNIANGAHTFYARGFDPANNQGFSTTNAVTVSNSASTVTNFWAVSAGGTAADFGYSVGRDSAGNVVVGGSVGNRPHLSQRSPSGTLLWTTTFGSFGSGGVMGIATDTSDNVLVTGYFNSSVDFGGGLLTSAGGYDIFIAKYSSSGTHVWSKRFGSNSTGLTPETGYGIAVDTNDNSVIITGVFENTVDFGGGGLVNTNAGFDMFLAKFNSAGNHTWSKRFGGHGTDEQSNSVAVDSSGNVVITGWFNDVVDFGGGSFSSGGGAGGFDIFVAKYSSVGAHTWSKQFGSASALTDQGKAVAVDGSGNVYVTGNFKGTVDFGGGNLTAATDGFSFVEDIFMLKLSSSGTHVWSKRIGSVGTEFGNAIKIDNSGNVIIGGRFAGTVTFGGVSHASAGSVDAFVAKYTGAGVYAWSKTFGSSNIDEVNALAVGSGGEVCATGRFFGTVNFGYGPLTSAGNFDIWLAVFAP